MEPDKTEMCVFQILKFPCIMFVTAFLRFGSQLRISLWDLSRQYGLVYRKFIMFRFVKIVKTGTNLFMLLYNLTQLLQWQQPNSF